MKGSQTDQPKGEEPQPDDDQSDISSRPEPNHQDSEDHRNNHHLEEHAQIGSGQKNVDQHIHNVSQQAVTTRSSPHPIETILGKGVRRLLAWGIPLSGLALLFGAPPPDEGLWVYTLVHLTIIQLATFAFTVEMTGLTERPWFPHVRRPWLASASSLIAAVVGFSALLTLATSAAARYDASLQFLQLLSSLDIAWVVAALYLGARRLSSGRTATIAGLALLVACVGSIAVYLSVVGFTDDGGWLVDGGELLRIVLPSDSIAAIISLTVLLRAAGTDQPMEQARLQS